MTLTSLIGIDSSNPETGKKASQSFVYDATNRLVEGTNWKGDKSAYTYNGLGLRVNNLVTTHAGKTYDRDYVIDYTSPENDDLYVYAMGNGQLEYEQRHVYAGSERLEQITEKGNGNWERTLYVHEDVMGNTRYYTKATGQSFAELQYDAWGQPVSPNKLVNNDHGNYVFATFTGHIYDTTLDIYFAEARFYDATNRTWMAMDPIKDGLNWYQYCLSNPTTNWDPTGLQVSDYFAEMSNCNNMILFPSNNDYLPDSWTMIQLLSGSDYVFGEYVFGFFFGIKGSELTLASKHPISAVVGYLNKGQAESALTLLFGTSPITDGSEGNAFLHAYWNALNSYYMGEDLAWQFGVAHEVLSKSAVQKGALDNLVDGQYTLREHNYMDLNNNKVGIEIGTSTPTSSAIIHEQLLNRVGSEAGIEEYMDAAQVSSETNLLGCLVGRVRIHHAIPIYLRKYFLGRH